MENTTTTSDTEPLRPSWKQSPDFGPLLRAYSTAAVLNDGTRPRPELWDISNGCILWLPPKHDIGEILDLSLSSREPGFFDHPILVLDVQITTPRDATVRFLKMTSLRKRSLEHIPPSDRNRYLPIFPAPPHPNNGLLLRLENEKPKRGMAENSYVSISEGVFSLDYRAFRCYATSQKADGYRHRLREAAFNQVVRELRFSSSKWIETGGLWEEFVRKHVPSIGTQSALASGV